MPRPFKQIPDTTPENRFAIRLRSLRVAAGFKSVREFHARLGELDVNVSTAAPSQWELGYNTPSLHYLPRIAKALESDIESMFVGVMRSPRLDSLRRQIEMSSNKHRTTPLRMLPTTTRRGIGAPLTEIDMDSFEGRFAVRLRGLRIGAGFASQDLFAQELECNGMDVTVKAVNHWEVAYNRPNALYLPYVAYTLRVLIDDMFLGV